MLTPYQFLKVLRDNGYGQLGVSAVQVLAYIYEHESASVKEVEDVLDCSCKQASRVIRSLRERGLDLVAATTKKPVEIRYINGTHSSVRHWNSPAYTLTPTTKAMFLDKEIEVHQYAKHKT